MTRPPVLAFAVGVTTILGAAACVAQQVCLPTPRLLTVTPMGGQAGTSVEVGITHEHVDVARELLFSTPTISAKPVVAADGKPVPNRFLVTIAADAPVGVHDARILSLGYAFEQATRVFRPAGLARSVDVMPETAPLLAPLN